MSRQALVPTLGALAAVLFAGCMGPAPLEIERDPTDGGPAGGTDAESGSGDSDGGSGGSPDAGAGDPDLGPSSGCGILTAKTGLQSRTMMIGGKQRTYLRFIPATYDPNTPLAVVVALHGTAGLAAQWRATYGLEAKAAGKAIFIYPNALPNAAGETKYQAFDPDSNDFKFVDALIEEIENDHCVDRNRIFATGFSLGGTFTANLGCWRGDVFRAIAPVGAGGGPVATPFTNCVGEVGDWQAIGSTDAEHTDGSKRIRNYYREFNGCAINKTATTPAGCGAYDGCRPEVPVTWCTYPGGHVWPTMATDGVWKFFNSFD